MCASGTGVFPGEFGDVIGAEAEGLPETAIAHGDVDVAALGVVPVREGRAQDVLAGQASVVAGRVGPVGTQGALCERAVLLWRGRQPVAGGGQREVGPCDGLGEMQVVGEDQQSVRVRAEPVRRVPVCGALGTAQAPHARDLVGHDWFSWSVAGAAGEVGLFASDWRWPRSAPVCVNPR
jgi:hypothetical protein